MKSQILVIAIILLLTACNREAQQVIQSSNSEIRLELLFVHDGCKVYRFVDGGRNVYWSDCRGNMSTSYFQSQGKSGTTKDQQSLSEGR